MSKQKNEVLEAVMFASEEDLVKRKIMLENNCLEIEEEYPVKRYFSDVERSEFQREYTDNSIKIARAMAKLEEYKAEIKAIVKPLIEQNLYLLANVREGYSERPETVYLFDFQDLGMMAIYDEKGELVDSKRLLPNQRQTNVVSMARKSGNG